MIIDNIVSVGNCLNECKDNIFPWTGSRLNMAVIKKS